MLLQMVSYIYLKSSTAEFSIRHLAQEDGVWRQGVRPTLAPRLLVESTLSYASEGALFHSVTSLHCL